MKILITGATGLVGSALSDLCRTDGIHVNYLTTSKKKIRSEKNLQGFYWNPKEDYLDEESMADVEVIVHLAGATIAQRWTPENKEAIFDSRIKTARMLFSTLSRKRKENEPKTVMHYISASAIGGYPSSLTKLYNETYPEYATGFLGEIVEEWEKSATEFQRLDIITTCVRTGIILDKEDGALPKIMKPITYGAGAPLGSGKQWQSWIHTEDMAGIYHYIIKNRLSGIYNAVAPYPVTNMEMTEVLAAQLDKPLLLPKVPKFALKLVLGDMAAIVLESQKVSAKKIREEGYLFKYKKIDQAIKDILDI
ncbi:TIGR01777 family oxidoreductase [Dokdonia sp. Hel_I_53]|uniref:TIGR01777 family oxidoreductase n=1 Tax=Dokdonia sp. Hel_I_53 TaxID=1566287 RepID=UPI00119BD2E9|nr:TIGR01777 family oxidoreductase [Dokdonia sp. Hel_I_53]TVZ53376.1 hypothetical protein OD90_2583 [Dokdonia sp. Hel_I_53]